MADASPDCMKECAKKYEQYLKPIKPGPGQTYDQAKAQAKQPLVKLLLDSGCWREDDRNRLDNMELLGLVNELCGCECSGYFPHAKGKR